jgi:hypothetical protein
MELVEPIDKINERLKREFGTDLSGKPYWRVVWSEDQLEKRHATFNDYTPEGIFIRSFTGVREVPKYSQWIKEKYVLEKLTIIPEVNSSELPVNKLSYEPIFPFETKTGKYLPPKFDAAAFVIETLFDQVRKAPFRRPEEGESPELAEQRLKALEESLFGNETDVGRALAYKEAIVVPGGNE